LKNSSAPIETEIKIRIPDGARAARALIESHGYRASVPRILQVDQVYDFPNRALRESGKLLRVRSEGDAASAILTFKGPVISDSPHKSREELETSAESRAVLEDILERLGLVPSFRYEKYRTTFVSVSDQPAPESDQPERGLIALDETPIGVFLELEGPAYWIDRVALKFGFRRDDYITASYASLYRDHLTNHPGPSDMVFLGSGIRSEGKDS
jgi:adenylate cyclase, class 2